MKLLINAKKLKVTKAMRDCIDDQLSKLHKLHKSIIEVQVTLESIVKKTNDPLANAATFIIAIPGKTVVVRERAADMSMAITRAAEASVRQLRKTYEKRLTLKRHRLAGV